MPTGFWISGLSATIFSLMLVLFTWMIWKRYVKELPSKLRNAANGVAEKLLSVKTGSIENLPTISAAFDGIDYEPLKRRWNQCFRAFKEVGDGKAFFDVDEVFQLEPFLDEALEQKTAKGSDRWILGGGILSFCAVTAIGFLTGNVAEQGAQVVIAVFGRAFAVLAFSALLSILYLVQEKRASLSAIQSYVSMLSRLKECLPPTGRNNLIQTMFLMQAEQTRNLKEQTDQMWHHMEEFSIITLSGQIGARFDDAIHLYLAPPIQKMADTQDDLLHRLVADQHKRLDQLFTLFATQVGGLLSEQLHGMAGSVSDATKGMREITEALNSVSGAVSVTLEQNRETTSQNSALLSELSATHGRLVERFSEATILLDDILTSSKILADTTTKANLSTIELSEMAIRLHKESGEKYDLLNKETGEKYNLLTQVTGEKFDLLNQVTVEKIDLLNQVTGEKFDLLRTTLDERLTASTAAAMALQGSLAAHSEEIRTGLGEYSTSVRNSMGEHSVLVRDSLGSFSTTVRDSMGEHSSSVRNSMGEYSTSLRNSFEEFSSNLQQTLEVQARLTTEQQREQAEQATMQQKAQAEQASMQQREQAEQATMQQREQAEQASMQQRAQAEQASMQQRAQAEQAAMQQREQAERIAQQQLTLSEQISQQQKEFAVQLGLRHKDMVEQLNLQQRENAEQLTSMQRESAEQLTSRQRESAVQLTSLLRESAEQLSSQQGDLTDKLFGTLFADARAMEEHTMSTLQQAQAWSLEVSRDFAQSANTLFDKIKIQNQELSQEIQAQGRSNTNMLITTNKILVETSANQNRLLEEHSAQLLDAMKTDAETLLHSLHQEGAGLLQVLPAQMKEAFDSFTASMGETMRSTLTDSVDIIDKLGQKTEQLHSEFAMYFSRTEGNTNKLVDDLRFAMEGAIGKFAEMSNDSLNQLRDGNMEAMTSFAEQTRILMEAVDEQTRTISLYIKDMGIDMGDLNKGLKSSVSEFSNQLQMGVAYTFKEFDTGLAEIVQRMTELGTSIEEAVQALPETIGRLNQGKG